MQEEDYAFVTLDSDIEQVDWSNVIVIDIDNENDFANAIMIDEDFSGSDFITLSDDTIMLSDVDMLDINSTDMDIDSATISFGL